MNQLKTTALLGLLSGLLVAVGYGFFGGASGALLGLGLAAVMNLGSWYFSDKIALAAYGAQPIDPQQAPDLHRLMTTLCDRAQLPLPALYIIPTDAPNAFATGRDPEHAAVAVTEGILRQLPEDELAGVLAHELSHIRNRDTLTQAVAATVAGAISYLAQMASYSLWFRNDRDDDGPNPIALLVGTMLAPIAATIVQLAISRTREFAADASAAELTGDPLALARALQRLETNALPIDTNPAFAPLLIINPTGNWLRNLFSTHPATADRIAALRKLAA